MSQFKVNVVAASGKDDQRTTSPIELLDDSGSERTSLPADAMQAAVFSADRQRSFQTAIGKTIARPVGSAILRSGGFETIDAVVLAEAGGMLLLGVRTLEGFGVMVDNLAHRLAAPATIVAGAAMAISRNNSYWGDRS